MQPLALVALRLTLGIIFASVYAVCGPHQRGSRLGGGARVRMCGLADFSSCGKQACAHTKLPRALTSCIRSYFFVASSSLLFLVFAEIGRVEPGSGGEIQLTDGIARLLGDFKRSPIVADRGSASQWFAAIGLGYTF